MIRRIVYVLMSGGIDSTTCALLAKRDFEGEDAKLVGLSFMYGQRHTKEVEYAHRIANDLGMHHRLWNIGHVLPRSGVTDPDQVIPQKTYGELGEGVSPSFVAFRNGTHLSIATALLHDEVTRMRGATGDDSIVGILFHGAHADDAANWAYPDCTPEFLGAMANAIYVGTYGMVRMLAPLTYLTKSQVVLAGYGIGKRMSPKPLVQIDLSTWSCYEGGEIHCGLCPTCQSRQEAFLNADIQDRTQYEKIHMRWQKIASHLGWQFNADEVVP